MSKEFDTKPNSVVRERKKMKEQKVETATQKPPISEEPSIGFDFAEQNTSITPANMPKHINVSAIPQEQEKPTKKIGQPRKYNEETKHISFSLPVSVVDDLKVLAGLRKTNQTQLVLSLIKNELEKEGAKINAYKELLN